MKISKALTWDEVADIYDREYPGSARPARTLPMAHVAEQVSRMKNIITDPSKKTLHKIIKE